MQNFNASNGGDHAPALEHLKEHGYVVFEGMLSEEEREWITASFDDILAREREAPFDPGDGPESPDDEAMREYLERSYHPSDAELERVMKRIRWTRAQNQGTPWPVGADEVNHNFLHIPLLQDGGKSQRSYNLPAKLDACGRLIEHPVLLGLLEPVLAPDFILFAMGATSVGAHTYGGYWHVDAPLTMCPEPLPVTPLAVQCVWMIDAFTPDNGASQVVPGSHRSQKKPPWHFDSLEGEVSLTGPAGSVAMWLSNTWHRPGPNVTDSPRRGIVACYSRSWVKPFTDYTRSVPPEVVQKFSPRVRYLLGWSAFGPVRG